MVGHFKIDQIKNCQGITYPKPHILFYNNDSAIWHGLQDIKHIIINIMADGRPFKFDRVELF